MLVVFASIHCIVWGKQVCFLEGGRWSEWDAKGTVSPHGAPIGDLKAPCVERVWMRCFLTSFSRTTLSTLRLYDSTMYTGGAAGLEIIGCYGRCLSLVFCFFVINISLRFRIRHSLPPSFPALPSFLPMFKSDRLPRLFLGIIKMQSTFR